MTDIHEIVLRWVIANADTNLRPPAAYCLGYTEGEDSVDHALMDDPPRDLLERFGELTVPVRPASACEIVGGGEHAVIDTMSKGYGLLIGVGPPQTQENHITVPVGYMQGGDVGMGWKCALRPTSGRWAVDYCEVMFHI